MSFSLSLLRLSLVARQAILRLQLEIAEDSVDPAEIIHGFERFELWIIRGRERLADVDTEDTWGDLRTWELGAGTPGVTNHLDLANLERLTPSAVLALSLSDFYCDNYLGINSLLSRDYCSNIVIRSWPVLCLLHKCFDTRHCQNAHACCKITFFMTFDSFEE